MFDLGLSIYLNLTWLTGFHNLALYAFTSYDNVGHIVKIPEDYFALYCRLTLDIESLEMYSSAYYNKPS